VADEHGFALAWLALWPPVALALAVAEADGLAVFVAGALVLAGGVTVLVGLSLTLGLAVPLAAPPAGLALPLAGGELDTEPPAATFGLSVLPVPGLAVAVEEGLGGHAVAVPLTWAVGAPPGTAPPPAVFIGVPAPAGPSTPWLLLEVEIPTAEPSWTMASRSGGTARAIPMANTAQATARAGRNSPYFHFHGCGRLSPGSPAPPRTAFQRRTRSARKPPDAPACACLLA
jgi:hypothetical protein